MLNRWKPLLRIFLLVVLFDVGMTVLGRFYFPADSRDLIVGQPIGTGLADYLMFYDKALNREGEKLVLIGASNVREGFPVPLVQRALPSATVFSMTVGGGNVTSMRNIVELALDRHHGSDARSFTFVYGIWFGTFLSEATGRKTGFIPYVENERLRFGLYKKTDNGIVPTVPPEYMPAIGILLRPCRMISDFVDRVRAWFFNNIVSMKLFSRNVEPEQTGDAYRNAIVLSEAQRKAAMDNWNYVMGGSGRLEDEQFSALVDLARLISGRGARLVLMELPMPRWHQEASAYFRDYQTRKTKFLAALGKIPNVYLGNMQDLNESGSFYDSAHPKPKATQTWVDRLVGYLKKNVYGTETK